MKLLSFAAALVLTVCTANAQGTYEAIVNATPASTNSGAMSLSGTLGWSFQPNEPIQVTSLGCLSDVIARLGANQIGIWDSTGTLVASNSLSLSSPSVNQSLYESVTPVDLDQGKTYYVGIYFLNGTSLSLVGGSQGGSFTNASQILVGGLVQGNGNGFLFPGQDVPYGQGVLPLGPNFQFLRTVPEPSACALLGLGALCLAALRRKH